MQPIEIPNKFIHVEDIQKCIAAFENISSGKEKIKRIEIIATTKVEGVDPLLISYFILFKQQIPELQIILHLPFNPIDSEDTKLEYQLKQFGTYAYLVTGINVFQILFGNEHSEAQIKFDLDRLTAFPDGWFVFSADYFPMLLVNDDDEFFDFIFTKSLSSLLEKINLNINELNKNKNKLDKGKNESEESLKWNKNSEQLKYNYYRAVLKSSKPKKQTESLLHLARMAFVNSLNEAKIAHLFFEKEYDSQDYLADDGDARIQAGQLVNKNAFKYYNEIRPVFEELKESSLAHQFFFSTILATEMLRDRMTGKDALNKDTKDSFINKVNSLWGFTKDLVAGIKELAKNIREHSSPPVGIISVRLFRLEKWLQTKALSKENDNVYNNFNEYLLKKDFNSNSSIIEINVIDIGKSGVIPTLIENTKSVFEDIKIEGRSSDLEKLIEEDIESLQKQTIEFRNLLDTSKQQLNQQAKRSIAHFGLLTLSKLVSNNKGVVTASSQNTNRESVCLPKIIEDYSDPIKTGTKYSIVLPIKLDQSYKTHLPHMPHNIGLPFESTAKDIKGVEKLFEYELVNLSELQSDTLSNLSSKYLIEFTFKDNLINNRKDEDTFWNKILADIKSLPANLGVHYAFCFNLVNVTINKSQLFRLLGKFELYFPSVPSIIFNLHNECYQGLLKINGQFHEQNPKLAYWNESISTLIYSYQNIRGDQFNFSDVLWGKTREEFGYLNRLVSFSAFNSTWIIYEAILLDVLNEVNQTVDPNTEMFFLNTNNLLPFDLFLRGSDNKTLFEENSLVLLKNELKAHLI